MANDFDLVVIGAGSGGVRAARMAAGHGARVAIIEERFFGGTCVNVGCVPKKLFAYGAGFPDEFRLAADYGYTVDGWSFDWATLRDNKTREIERLNGIYRRLLDNAGVTVFEGHGRIEGAGRVSVDGDIQLNAERILIATGGKPFVPDFPGNDRVRISDDLFYLERLPDTVAVVGGGYIASEFASILNGLGVTVHQLYRRELFLRGFDHDVRTFVAERMGANGVKLHFNTDVAAIEERDGRQALHLVDGGELVVDQVFYATGRVPRLDDLLAEGVELDIADNGAVRVDEGLQTSLDGVYALGDVIDRLQLTPVALAEGTWLAAHWFAEDKPQGPLDYRDVPTAVFCHPNIGTVGFTEEEALERFGTVRVYRGSFRPMRYTLGDIQEKTLIKLIVDDASDRVVGLHMAGEEAAEITQGFAVAIRMGATKADFDRTIGIHPTSAEEFVTLRQGETVTL
ncbi:glutathione-disulfide reductase [Alloalcanivorax profundimaris]|uniref:glutathione-disulfide reductase n=1 Tax=Alloalcanivorax profundimaris TaxID=2735259 RepID=UPI0018874D9D|nr:glutathione-disulfide reductase [Alloalcanivorax profundimaris]MBF1801372.1 glutathione-disulfide reductase [Alloalcanivorax profundimaris]